jgi:2'-5' RNA ligase
MSFIGLKVPHETARLLGGLDVPGKREDISSLHVTMFYFGNGLDIGRLTDIIRVTFGVVANSKPFTVRTNRVTSFPAGDNGTPIICRVESDALHDLREKIRKAYVKNGVEFANNHPEYKPHVTLSYAEDADLSEKGEADFTERSIPVVEWGAHELVLWGGDSGDNKLVVHFPFALGGDFEKMAFRVIQRYARREG